MTEIPKAIFFDFDGVIVESGDIKTEAFTELFSAHPNHAASIKQYHLDHVGISRFAKFEWIYANLLMKPLTKEESESLGRRFSEIALHKVIEAPLVEGALDLLRIAKEKSILTFIVSGTPMDELKEIVKRKGLAEYFEEVFGHPHSKEEAVLSLLSKYQLANTDCCFIGDGNTDYKAAKATGVHFIARNTPQFSDFWSSIPGIVVYDDLMGVLPLLQNDFSKLP